MRKSNLVKAMACFMAATMAVTCVPSVNATTAITAQAETTVPAPVASFSFGEEIANKTYTENGITFSSNFASIQETEDKNGATNKVLYLNDTYLESTENAFSNVDFSQGFSISMDIKPDIQPTDWDYVFSIGKNSADSADQTFSYLDGTIGFIMRMGDEYTAFFPADGWQDGNPVNSDYAYFLNVDNTGKWYHFTYVYSADGFAMYVNGIPTVKYAALDDAQKAVFTKILSTLPTGKLRLGCGIDPAMEHTSAYYDNVKIFNSALTAEQAAALASEKADTNTATPSDTAPDNTTDNAVDTTGGAITQEPDTPIIAPAPDTTPDPTTPEPGINDNDQNDQQDASQPNDDADDTDDEDEAVVKKAAKLNKKKATVKVGKSVKLKVKNTSKKVTWSSSNKKVAKVSKAGKVTGVKAGKATIKAKVDGKALKCKVTVK